MRSVSPNSFLTLKFYRTAINQNNHHWKKYQCTESLEGKTLLIVGAGRTGQLIAKKAKSFDMNVIGIKKHKADLVYFDNIDTLDNIDIYLPYADYVVCTIPLTDETTRLFHYERFIRMKPSSCFINISRSRIIVQEDLVKCLNESKIGCAILDVFDNEPLPQDDILWSTSNLYITPHSSGRLTNFMDEAINIFIVNFNAYVAGDKIPNKINLYDGY